MRRKKERKQERKKVNNDRWINKLIDLETAAKKNKQKLLGGTDNSKKTNKQERDIGKKTKKNKEEGWSYLTACG